MNPCLLCGRPLPRSPWWRWVWPRPPYCTGEDLDECWLTLNRRVGIRTPAPRPDDA
jgi:hypothetical protein